MAKQPISRRAFLYGSGMLLTGAILSACGGNAPAAPATTAPNASNPGPTATKGASAPAATPAATVAASGPVSGEITVWVFPLTDDDKAAFWDNLMKQFGQDNPNVKANIEIQPWANRQQKMLTAVAGGTPPDIAYLNLDFLARFATDGAIESLDDILDPDFKTNLLAPVKQGITYQGKAWVSPILMSSNPPVYNATLMKSAGLDPEKLPEDWQGITEFAEKIKAKGQLGISFGGSAETTNQNFNPLLWEAGGEIFSQDGKTVTFNGPEGNQALEFFKSWIDKGYSSKDMINGGTDDFASSRAGLEWCSSTSIAALKKQSPDVDVRVGPTPKGPKNKTTYGTLAGYALFKLSKAKPAAAKWLQFMEKPANMTTLLKPTPYLAPVKSVDVKDLAGNDKLRLRLGEEAQNMHLDIVHLYTRDVMKILAPELQACQLGQKSPKQALDDAANAANKFLAQQH